MQKSQPLHSQRSHLIRAFSRSWSTPTEKSYTRGTQRSWEKFRGRLRPANRSTFLILDDRRFYSMALQFFFLFFSNNHELYNIHRSNCLSTSLYCVAWISNAMCRDLIDKWWNRAVWFLGRKFLTFLNDRINEMR